MPFPSRLLLAAALACSLAAATAEAADPAPQIPEFMRRQMEAMTPQARQRVMALSPETRQKLVGLFSRHQRHSDTATLRQVMHELESDFQAVLAGLLVDNGEMAATAARRLADHRLPRGGMLAYLPAETVTDETLSVLTSMNEVVEGGALRLAEAAEKGDIAAASGMVSDILSGCVSCHAIFRGQPGRSADLQPAAK